MILAAKTTYNTNCGSDSLARKVLSELDTDNTTVSMRAGDLTPDDADLVGLTGTLRDRANTGALSCQSYRIYRNWKKQNLSNFAAGVNRAVTAHHN